MFEGLNDTPNQPAEKSEIYIDIDEFDQRISDLIGRFENAGLNMEMWNHEYENLREDGLVFKAFYDRLMDFRQLREDALSVIEFDVDMTPAEKERLREFDREVMRAYKDHENFLGNGATAEVYAMSGNDTVCVKFIIDQERYNENNSIRKEHDYLSRVYEHTKDGVVRTPYPIFVRVHPTEGHAYGMEKIQGASLSQILEFPEKFSEEFKVAQSIDRDQMKDDLLEFVRSMHEAGVTHGDLFKRNIMLGIDGRPYVIDFGKSRNIEPDGLSEDRMRSDRYLVEQQLQAFFNDIDKLS